jgi:hypothetical protein
VIPLGLIDWADDRPSRQRGPETGTGDPKRVRSSIILFFLRESHRLSLKGALQALQAYEPALREWTRSQRSWLWAILLESIAFDEVGHRPNRVGPRARARKRRRKP